MRIRTLDSSRTPLRGGRVTPARGLPAADLPAIRSALAQLAAGTADPHEDLAASGGGQLLELQTRLWARERELASASARVAELETALRTEKGHQHPGAPPAD